MSAELYVIVDSLNSAMQALIPELHEAYAKNDAAQISLIKEQLSELRDERNRADMQIQEGEINELEAVADRLEDLIEAQRAIGLSAAAEILKEAVSYLRPAPEHEKENETTSYTGGSIAALPGDHKHVIDTLIKEAEAVNLDPLTVLVIVAIESDFKLDARSPWSSAGGLFQFLDKTWKGAGGKEAANGGGENNGHASYADLETQTKIGCAHLSALTENLADALGQSPTKTALYMAHQQGLTGALKLLKANRTKPVEEVIGEKEAANNLLDGLTVSQALSKLRNLVRIHEDEVKALVSIKKETAGQSEEGTGGSTGAELRLKAVSIAINEMQTYARKNGKKVFERDAPLKDRARKYFEIAGSGSNIDPTTTAWSAAFISSVMHLAGVSSDQFPMSANHAKYILLGLQNDIDNKSNTSIVYYDKNEIAPRVGDLIGFSRTPLVKNRDDIAKYLPDKFFKSHTDLVVATKPGRLKVIGGNVGETINVKTVQTDPKGKIVSPDKYFFVLRLNF